MTDRPKQDETPSVEEETFEEALDAAEVFHDLTDDEEAPSGEEAAGAMTDAFADEFQLAARRLPAEAVGRAEAVGGAEAVDEAAVAGEAEGEPYAAPEPEEAEAADEALAEPPAEAAPVTEPARAFAHAATGGSIGELFKPVVKHSPPSRIRIETNSVGALFRRFIEQE